MLKFKNITLSLIVTCTLYTIYNMLDYSVPPLNLRPWIINSLHTKYYSWGKRDKGPLKYSLTLKGR